MSLQPVANPDPSTEQKIKDAARTLFIQKGFASITTREIAERAGINKALLNYHYRSKEKLFDSIMEEQVTNVFGRIFPIINNPQTSLEEKVGLLIDTYTDLLLAQPGAILFVLNEIQRQPDRLAGLVKINRGLLQSAIVQQLQQQRPDIPPMQLIMSMMGMMLFPYVGQPIFQGDDPAAFIDLLKARKTLIPPMVNAILKMT